MNRRNRPRIEFRINEINEENTFLQEWILTNQGHGTARNVETTFELKPQSSFNSTDDVLILVKRFPISRNGDMAPARISPADWLGMTFFSFEHATQFEVWWETEAIENGRIKRVTLSHQFPVGKYLVTIKTSGDNLRDKDRAMRDYVLDFVKGIPLMRPFEKDEAMNATVERFWRLRDTDK